MRVNLSDVRTDLQGFVRLAGLSAQIESITGPICVIDCTAVRWFDANMTAALAAVVAHHRIQGKLVRQEWPRHRAAAEVLRKNGFLTDFPSRPAPSMVPHMGFRPADKIGFAEYAAEHLQGKGIPRMSLGLRRYFLLGLDELFGNVDLHADTDGDVFVSGQAYPEMHRLHFNLADCGIGIRESIRRRLGLQMGAGEAIEWALTGHNTTRMLDVPGGLGLKIVRDFVGYNQGSLTIVSDRGYWQQIGTNRTFQELPHPFPGTVVSLELRTDDPASYALAGEKAPSVQF